MSPRAPKRAAVYARLSVTTEESVSIARQVAAATKYAEARGWSVALVATDDGVSASKRKPEEREGWRAILDSPETFQVVIVWKVDRLARRVIDFVNADAALQARGASLVAVEDPIDLTTAQGRAFAQMLAVFGELEAASIGARVKGARAHLAREGRAVGARPWPFESVPNPDGPGLVWRPIPERAEAIRQAAEALTARETSLAAVARDWTKRGYLPPLGGSSWSPSTVRRLLTNPVLTGATPSGDDVVRNADGTVKRDRARQILTPAAHRALLSALTSGRAVRGGARPVRLPLLHGIATCATCGGRMLANRYADGSRPDRYVCGNRECSQRVGVEAVGLDAFVVSAFLAKAPELPVEAEEVVPDPEPLADLHEALEAVQASLVASEDDDETTLLVARRKALRSAIREAEDAAPVARAVSGVTVEDLWLAARTDDERREAISAAIVRVVVKPTKVRRGSRVADRTEIDWRRG